MINIKFYLLEYFLLLFINLKYHISFVSIFLFAYILLLFKICKTGSVKMLETTEEDGIKYFGKIVDLGKECYPLEFKVNGISGFLDKSRKKIAKS